MQPRAPADELWAELAEFFEEDDGSLLEVRFVQASRDGRARIFERLVNAAKPAEHRVWDSEREEEVLLTELPSDWFSRRLPGRRVAALTGDKPLG